MGAEAYRTRYETGIEAATNGLKFSPDDEQAARATMQSNFDSLDPSVKQEVGGAYQDLNESLFGGLDKIQDPAARFAEFQKRRAGLLITAAGIPPAAAYAAEGGIPPTLRTDIPSPTGLTEPGMGIVGGFGGGLSLQGGGAPGVSRTDTAAGAGIPPVAAPGGVAAMGGPTTFGGQPGGVLYPAPEGQSTQTTDITNESAAVIKNAPTEMMRLNMMDDAMHVFQAGGWSKDRTHLASDAQGLKNALDDAGIHIIPQSAVDAIAPKNLSGAQLFSALLRPFVTQQLRDAVSGTGAGRIREEVTAFLNSASESTDPLTLLKLINQVKFGVAVGYDRAHAWRDYRQLLVRGDPSVAGMYPGDFYQWYNDSPRLENIDKAYGGNMDMSPYSTKGVLGIGGKTFPTPPAGALRLLESNPGRYRTQFDSKYGPGAAERALAK